jgi:ABC-2 type transport system ATP-binding protein
VRDLIPELANENRAVFLCSHLLHEVELVCNRVMIIKQGVMIADSTVRELVTQGQQLKIKVPDPRQASEVLKGLPWIKSVKIEDGHLIVDAPKDSAAQINQALAEHGIFASELVNQTVSLEDVFLQLTGGNSGD